MTMYDSSLHSSKGHDISTNAVVVSRLARVLGNVSQILVARSIRFVFQASTPCCTRPGCVTIAEATLSFATLPVLRPSHSQFSLKLIASVLLAHATFSGCVRGHGAFFL